MRKLFLYLAFCIFPGWYTRHLLRRALWEGYVAAYLEGHATGKPMRFSAAEFDAWSWLWSERRRLEADRDRFATLLDGMTSRNAQLKSDLARAVESAKAEASGG